MHRKKHINANDIESALQFCDSQTPLEERVAEWAVMRFSDEDSRAATERMLCLLRVFAAHLQTWITFDLLNQVENRHALITELCELTAAEIRSFGEADAKKLAGRVSGRKHTLINVDHDTAGLLNRLSAPLQAQGMSDEVARGRAVALIIRLLMRPPEGLGSIADGHKRRISN